MRRRTFVSYLAGAGALAGGVTAQPIPAAKIDYAALRDRLHQDLFTDYLPFIEKYVVDPEYGGFMCTVKPDGERVSTSKTIWFEGRGTWAFSFLYNNLSRDPKYVEIARKSVELVKKSEPRGPDEFWPKAITREGQPAGPADTEVYSDMFVAEGFAEFSKATGERKYWDEAKQIVLKCVHRYDRPDYHPTIGQTYLGPSAKPFPGARVEGVWMVLIRTTTQMLAMHPDPEIRQISDRAIDALMNHHYNPRFHLLNELMNHDLSRPENEYEQLVYAGHAIETLWMVMEEARRRKDKPLFDRAAELFQRHCEVAKDRVYGGLFRNLRNVDENDWTMDKTLFPHQEALNGAILLIEQRGDPWAIQFYQEINSYTREKFPMRALHSPLWQVAGDRQVHLTPDMKRAENYHQPRFLMLNLLAAQKLAARKGTPLREI
jgi:N-acylglucosamine 2-epimerase